MAGSAGVTAFSVRSILYAWLLQWVFSGCPIVAAADTCMIVALRRFLLSEEVAGALDRHRSSSDRRPGSWRELVLARIAARRIGSLQPDRVP